MVSRVFSFRIVLADGSIEEVFPPVEGATTKKNDDLYYAVRGGASGSWGVLTEISFIPYVAEDYFSVFWLAGFVWDTDGVANLYRTFSELGAANADDRRWSVSISATGDASIAEDGTNKVYLEMVWVGPVAEAEDYDPSFFQTFVDACTGCIQFLDLPDSVEPLMVSLNFKYVSGRARCA